MVAVAMENNKRGEMKRSESELALQEVIKKTTTTSSNNQRHHEISSAHHHHKADSKTHIISETNNNNSALLSSDFDAFFGDICSSDLSFSFKTREKLNGFSACEVLTQSPIWSQNIKPKQTSISVPIDAQSSVCVGSPMSATKPKGRDNQTRVTTIGSSREQSDEEEIEAGPCEQSTNPIDLKRIRRMVSNRESARRSRRRKQAHFAELESHVDQLTGENASLYKQLSDATQQYRHADIDNRVLKSDVEALRAKVKLAEDMVARGSVTCNSNPIIQNHLISTQPLGNHNLHQVANVSPSITVHGDDMSYSAMAPSGQNPGIGTADFSNASLKSSVISEAVSCVSDMWP